MPWKLVMTKPAKRDLAGADERVRRAVRETLERLVDDPGSVDLLKLGGRKNEWRVRVGSWRAILTLHNDRGEIELLRVLPRGRAYR